MSLFASGGVRAAEARAGDNSGEESNTNNANVRFSLHARRGAVRDGYTSSMALVTEHSGVERYCKLCGCVVMGKDAKQLEYWWEYHRENHKQMYRVGKGHWEERKK